MSDKPTYEAGFGSDALATPQRVVFVTRKTSATVRGPAQRQLMAYPHLLLREAIVLQVLTIVLVVIGLFWDAPLEQLANPLVTPNPAKAPWYFLGLQELAVIPYSKVNIEGRPLWDNHAARRFRVILAVLALFLVFLARFEAWTVLVPTVIAGGLLATPMWRHRAPDDGRDTSAGGPCRGG
jgi:hypothetical protein